MKVINKRWKKITAAMIAIVMLITIGGITTHRVVEASAFDAARSAARQIIKAFPLTRVRLMRPGSICTPGASFNR